VVSYLDRYFRGFQYSATKLANPKRIGLKILSIIGNYTSDRIIPQLLKKIKMDTLNIYSRFILYNGQKNDRDIIKSNSSDLISKIIFKNRTTNSKKQPPKTKVYPFFHRYLRLMTTSHVSSTTSHVSTTTSHVSMITSFRSSITSFSSMTTSFSSTITSHVSTITSHVSTITSLASTTHGLASMTKGLAFMIKGLASTIKGHVSTITSLGRKNDLFLNTILRKCNIQIVKFIEKKGSPFGQRLLFLNKSY